MRLSIQYLSLQFRLIIAVVISSFHDRLREWCCQKVQVMGINRSRSRRCITQLRRNMNIISDFSGYKWRHRSPQEIVQVSRIRSRVTRAQESAGHWSQAEQCGARGRALSSSQKSETMNTAVLISFQYRAASQSSCQWSPWCKSFWRMIYLFDI